MTPLSVERVVEALEGNRAATCLVVSPDLHTVAELMAYAELFRFGDSTMPNLLKGHISYRVDRAMPAGTWRLEVPQ